MAVLEEKTGRLDALTGIRWWAAFMVFCYHMREFAPLPNVIRLVFDQGYYGVTFFFVLSGFVLTWSMRPRVPTSTFYWRRFARIWPSTMVALLLAIPVFYTLGPIPEGSFLKPFSLGIILLSVVMLQAWSMNPAVFFGGNPAAWTLSVEFFFYALHPWISRVLVPMARRGALLLAAGVLVYAFAYRAAVIVWPMSWLAAVPLPVVRLPEFVLGMALAWAMRAGWRLRVHPVLGVGALAAVVLFVAASATGRVPQIGTIALFGNELFTVACALAIVSLATFTLRGRRSWFESRWQVVLGTWSFAFYLIHATGIYLARRVFGLQEVGWSNLAWFALILAIDLVLAWALYRFVEHPVEGRMRRWKDHRDRRTAELAA